MLALTESSVLTRWSDLHTWLHNEPPIAGDFAVVPPYQTVLLDVSPPPLFVLLIQGTLVFDQAPLTLDATYILVEGGVLEVGTPDAPFTHPATITLHGDRYDTIALPDVGAKCLVAYMPMTMAGPETMGLGSDGVASSATGMTPRRSVLGTWTCTD